MPEITDERAARRGVLKHVRHIALVATEDELEDMLKKVRDFADQELRKLSTASRPTPRKASTGTTREEKRGMDRSE